MLNSLQNPLSLIGRVLLALLFVPAGFSKIGGFAGAVGYAAAKGVPLPELAIAIAIVVELGLGLLLIVGFQTRWAALVVPSLQLSSRLSSTPCLTLHKYRHFSRISRLSVAC